MKLSHPYRLRTPRHSVHEKITDRQPYDALCPGFRIGLIRTLKEFRRCEELQAQIWNYSCLSDVVPSSLLAITPHNGGILLGAFDRRNSMVGFVYSILGLHHGQLVQHSHMLGVLPAWQHRNIGLALKLAQRDCAMAMGLKMIVWTFDPLQSGNARFNFWRLGVTADAYIPDLYGRSSSSLHGSLPTDRFMACWHLRSPRTQRKMQAALAGTPQVDRMPRGVLSHSAFSLSPSDSSPSPVIPVDRGVLIEIPTDLAHLKKENPGGVARRQRILRKTCLEYFSRGWQAIRFYQETIGSRCRSFYHLAS